LAYDIKPLSCDPTKLKGLSEKLIVSHWENNYGGAVKRLNVITGQLASLDIGTTPGPVINGLKREELIAMNSMILHELYFDSLGDGGEPDRRCVTLWRATSGAWSAGEPSSSPWARHLAVARVGSC
jgi:Fe-Mn family superoxide dismutase